MARRKRLCMISTEAENEQQHNEAQSQSNGHSANETNDANSSQMDTTTIEHSDNQNELGELDSIGPPKKVRGPTQKNKLWNMNKNKIVVKFNKYGKPVGVEGNELRQFLGSVVRIAGNVRLHCEDWRKEKFVFHPAETSAIKKWVLSSMGKKLNTWRNLVKSRNYDPALSVEEIMERQTDSRVNPEQFQVLVNRWMKPEYQAICEQKRISRSKMEEPHITGTKSFARLAEEEATKNNGLLKLWHPYKLLKMTTNTQGIQEDDWTNDEFSKVKGPDKSGYVRCVGKMLSLRNNGASSSTSSQTVEHRLAQTEDILYTLVNLLKDPTTNSNLPDILRSMNIHIPDNFSPGQNNSTNGNIGNSDQRSSVADQNICTQTNLS
ncbi:transposase, Ptta/En/Spm [Tanacetum coccineum]|uniref:Transposase, Ptta/En/Spm n=1 Tax=Tanacetum coccineum TaxID=301880 RepID=A0ABQ5HAK3_9ASTR